MFIDTLAILILIIFFDYILRDEKVKPSYVRLFETFCFFILIIYIGIKSGTNLKTLSLFVTILASSAFVLKEFLGNVFATMVLYMFPQFETGDVLKISFSMNGGLGDLEKENFYTFSKLGILRSPLISVNGDVVLIPNRYLLNDIIIIK